jgi:hypothetical protein
MAENRTTHRNLVFKAGTIEFGGSVIDCTIRKRSYRRSSSSGCTQKYGVISRCMVNLIMCTGGAYRPFLHDRHFRRRLKFPGDLAAKVRRRC